MLHLTVFITGIYKECNSNHYLLVLVILPDLVCTANKIRRSFVRIFHDSRKYLKRTPKGISRIAFPANNDLTTGCTFFRSVQGNMHGVFILLSKGAFCDLMTKVIPPCLISLPFSVKEKFTLSPTISLLTITILWKRIMTLSPLILAFVLIL